MGKTPNITVHGRFQPPCHANHWNYIVDAFNRAEHVTILITNPYLDEKNSPEANHRNKKENNPFTYEQRVEMFRKLLTKLEIAPEQYDFLPFDIKSGESFKVLDKDVPNLVNSYSEWSEKKADIFRSHGLQVIQTYNDKVSPVNGSMIRSIIKGRTNTEKMKSELLDVGFLPEALEGLVEAISS